jgi:hypothetical protein
MCFLETNGRWAHTPLRQWWNFGFESESILRILQHLPQGLSSAMYRLLDTLHFLSESSAYRLQLISRLVDSISNTGELSAQDDKRKQFEDEEVEWEKEEVFALICLDFDPSTQMRISVRSNSRAALLWNLKKNELLLRFANYDLLLPFTDLDWLRVLVLDLRSYFQNVTVHYYRMMVGSGMDARAMIVCVTKIKTFTSMGRISQVSHVLYTSFSYNRGLTRGSLVVIVL